MENVDFSLRGFTNCVEIDRGGSAVIYRAEQPEFGRQVAIKVLSLFRDPAAAERFNTERKTMGQLSHAQGIVSVYASGMTDQGDPYLVLPFYESGSLQDELDYEGPLRWRKAAQHIIEVCRSVDFAHSKGVHHRDIKPANLLVADDGNVHIADFGIASLALADPGEQLLCTPAFAPPEVLEGDTGANPISIDVYGLGASLWSLLDGRAPFSEIYSSPDDDFKHYTMQSWATTHQLEHFAELVHTEPVGDLRHTVPDPICATIEQAMSKNPAERFSSALALGNALRYSIRLSAEELVQRQPARLSSASRPQTLVADRVPTNAAVLDEPETLERTEQLPAVAPQPEQATSVYHVPGSGEADGAPPPPPGSALPGDDKQSKVGSSLLILAAIVTLVVFAMIAVLLRLNRDNSPPGGVVENYVGSSVQEAKDDAAIAGWNLLEVPVRKDGTVAGEVVEQEVAPGTELEAEKILKLRVSEGAKIREMPDLAGLTEEEAIVEIEKANLKVGNVAKEVNEQVKAGEVAEALVNGEPAGDKYESDTMIDLVISTGPAEVTVPLVTTPSEAEQVFGEELGLIVVVVEEFSDLIEEGKVIRTDPAIGTKAKPGENISVVVSSGPKIREIPDVIGLSAAEATAALEAQGFTIEKEDRDPGNCQFKIIGEGRRQCDDYANGKAWTYGPRGIAEVGTKIRVLVRG